MAKQASLVVAAPKSSSLPLDLLFRHSPLYNGAVWIPAHTWAPQSANLEPIEWFDYAQLDLPEHSPMPLFYLRLDQHLSSQFEANLDDNASWGLAHRQPSASTLP